MRTMSYFFLIVFIDRIWGGLVVKQINVIYRHGDRGPVIIYPTDKNREDKWPNGRSELTDRGVRQQYRLGLWLRDRYSALMGPNVDFRDIHVRSSDFSRTLMSAQANLAGFVFNNTKEIVEGMPWTPVPIHTVPLDSDHLLHYNTCRLYEKERRDLYHSPYFKRQLAPYTNLLRDLKHYSEINWLDFSNSWLIYDTIFCEKSHNMTVSDWVTEKRWAEMIDLQIINWKMMFYNDLAKLAGGYLLHKINKNMEEVTRNRSYKKVMMYSGHDTDVGALSYLLGFPIPIQPPYASVIIFELLSNDTGASQFHVRVLYKNDTDQVTEQLIPGCKDSICPLSTFLKVTKEKTFSKKELIKICSTVTEINYYVIIGICGGFIGIWLIFCVFLYFHLKKTRNRYVRMKEGNN